MTVHSHELFRSSRQPFIAVGGITWQGQADAAVAFGVRCLVFDFMPGGIHTVSVDSAELVSSANVVRIGHFSAATLPSVSRIMRQSRLDYACLHGECEPEAAACALGADRVIRAFSAACVTQEALASWAPYCTGYYIRMNSPEDAARVSALHVPRPWLCSGAVFGCCGADGVELLPLNTESLLREMLELESTEYSAKRMVGAVYE